MAEPVTMTVAATAKEVAEKAALAAKESLKLSEASELTKQILEQNRIKELSKVRDFHNKMIEESVNRYNRLLEKAKEAITDPKARADFVNRLEKDSFLKGQLGEFHADAKLSQYGNFDHQVRVEINGRTRIVDFAGVLDKDMPIETVKMIDGKIKTVCEVIPAGKKIGVEIKNGWSDLKNKVEHVISQGLAAKENADKGLIGINKTMVEDMIIEPESYSNFFNKTTENDLRVTIMQPTMAQQTFNMISLFLEE